MALKVREYDIRQVYRGIKRSYAACTLADFDAANGTGVFATLSASATTIIRLQKVIISCASATAATYPQITLRKCSTLATGGTAVSPALVQVPFISSSAAGSSAAVDVYTAAPTTGTVVGTIASVRVFAPIVGTPAVSILPVTIDFSKGGELETPTLTAGSTQQFALGFGAAPGQIIEVNLSWYWTEETSTGA